MSPELNYSQCRDRLDNLSRVFESKSLLRESFETGGFVLGPSWKSEIDFLILTVVHGNESGSLIPVLRWLESFVTVPPKIQFAVLICHPEAAEKNVRFIEKDLNRCFGIGDGVSLEGRRAQSLENTILRSRFLIDLHQTNYETESDFFIFPDSPTNLAFASQICSETPIITHGLDFSKDGLTSDTFATIRGITSITYEMGQIGKTTQQTEKTLKILNRAAELAELGLKHPIKPANILQFSQVVTASTQRRLIPNLVNLSRVKKGDVLGMDEVLGQILVDHDGYILFPKYGPQAENSSELCHVLKMRDSRSIESEDQPTSSSTYSSHTQK